MCAVLWPALVVALTWVGKGDTYRIGVAIADVTGPLEIPFLGYARSEQKGTGIHLRQFARAFIIQDGGRRLVFVNVDCGLMGHGLRKEVVSRLQSEYGQTYTVENMMLSATHTHSTPGGFMHHMLFDFTTMGFVPETFEALASGIVQSVKLAHSQMVEGKIFVTEGELLDANINRSPTSYDQNPAEERERYAHNVDKTMTQMKFLDLKGHPLGVINWFAVHPTSMNNSNTLISSDNMGYASILFESKINLDSLLGKGPFVAAFASSNLGDVTPNTRGPTCQRSGVTCDVQTNRCPGRDECIASGPGNNMFHSTSLIAHKLMEKAWDLWQDPATSEVTGPIKIVHQYVDMPQEETLYTDSKTGRTSMVHGCIPAMGYSFGSGTNDGPSGYTISQLTRSPNPLWNSIRDFVAKPTPEDIECQGAKPIVLATGRMVFPYEWQPRIVSTQLSLIGNVAVASVPGEFTTMAGRRLRSSISGALSELGANTRVIVAGLVNTYSDYIVTNEEYQVQRYEAASTIFGPHTLVLYQIQYTKLARAIMEGVTLDPGPEPPDFQKDLLTFTPSGWYDMPPWLYQFGDCIEQPQKRAQVGQTVRARFIAANPRNNLMHNASFLTVERRTEDEGWQVVATDANWESQFHWKRTSMVLGNSEVLITWTVPASTLAGEYRIRHFGHYKYLFGGIFPYRGTSRVFKVESLRKSSRRSGV